MRVPELMLLDFDRTVAYLYEDRRLLCKLAAHGAAYVFESVRDVAQASIFDKK